MSITITDPNLLAQLAGASAPVEVRGPNGEYLGTFQPPFGKPPLGYAPPISDEELERRRQFRDGKPLSEILKRLRDGGS